MLSVFPDLLTFGLLAPVIIRVCAGGFFLLSGWHGVRRLLREKDRKNVWYLQYATSAVSLIAGLLVFVGLFTQPASLALAIVALVHARNSHDRLLFFLLFAMALSLLFSGAGFFAFDLPL